MHNTEGGLNMPKNNYDGGCEGGVRDYKFGPYGYLIITEGGLNMPKINCDGGRDLGIRDYKFGPYGSYNYSGSEGINYSGSSEGPSLLIILIIIGIIGLGLNYLANL